MFLRAYRRDDKRALQQLFYESVHAIDNVYYTAVQLDRWAPAVPERERWILLDSQYCFVVEAHKQLVGFAALNSTHLDWLYVHPNYQLKGVATALMRQMERSARKNGMPNIQAQAPLNARGFFERFGFRTHAEEVDQNGLFPHYAMEKRVAPAVKA
ncbi:MAG: GNAT family N-acetyltransferase [Saprospiraceae bacterium]